MRESFSDSTSITISSKMAAKKRKKRRKKQKFGSSYTAVMLLLAVVLFFIMKAELPERFLAASEVTGEMEAHFIDVGQGDSALIRLPHQSGERYVNILIDSGESGYGDEVITYLENEGVYYLDAIIVSHPHSDHMGCMDEIIDHFKVDKFYMPYIPDDLTPITRAYEDMLDSLYNKGISIKTIGSGDTLHELSDEVSGAMIKVIAPENEHSANDLNNCSLIIKLWYGKTSFLFTGDAEIEEYKNIRGQIGGISVLKVGHHGANNATDEALIAELCPKYAVISAGENNDYGHPHENTLKLLKKYGSEILRTDKSGSIEIKSDGENIKIA